MGDQVLGNTKYVLDGGALLHKVSWNYPSTYGEVIQQYCNYVTRKYGTCTIIFDGYNSSTKDQEHERRTNTKLTDVDLELQNEVQCKQSEFLSNRANKTQFIKRLSETLEAHGHMVRICNDDADTTIVQSAMEGAQNGQHTTVVADDTDILVMLLNMWSPFMADIVLRHEACKSIKKHLELISIKETVSVLPEQVIRNLLFIHAWGGCDTTSAIYNQGKDKYYEACRRQYKVHPRYL